MLLAAADDLLLGLGDIGALAGKPVMEGKGVLFKKFAGIDVFDIEVETLDPERMEAVQSARGDALPAGPGQAVVRNTTRMF